MATAHQDRPAKRRGWYFWSVLVILAWGIGTLISLATSVRAYSVPTASMSPSLKPGDRIGVDTRPGARPKRGEVWVFHMPPWASPRPADAVKRIIGLPGETVHITGGKVWINSRPLVEPYLAGPIPYSLPPTVLGRDQYFVLGDNRAASAGSNVWGPLPGEYLVGKVKARLWPIKRIGGL